MNPLLLNDVNIGLLLVVVVINYVFDTFSGTENSLLRDGKNVNTETRGCKQTFLR